MGKGFFQAEVFTGNFALPVANSIVTIKSESNETINLQINENGTSEIIEIEAPRRVSSQNPISPEPYYTSVDVEVSAEGFDTTLVIGVQIFEGETSILPVFLVPLGKALTGNTYVNTFEIPKNLLHSETKRRQVAIISPPLVSRNVVIPWKIRVNIGDLNDNYSTVAVPFIDYIKNVASSEIFPTWPKESIIANIHCFVSFALNRIYTNFYTDKGFDYDITSSPVLDQQYVLGRNIFKNVSDIVDEIFNEYIVKENRKEPFFSTFCNGVATKCNGFSQWGSVQLAVDGQKANEILDFYFDNITITSTSRITLPYKRFFGYKFEIGSQSPDIKIMQEYLNVISQNFPLIPKIKLEDGNFGEDTKAAVIAFQQTFGLPETGIIDSGTWYKISETYVSVQYLQQLLNEKDLINVPKTPPDVVLKLNSKGKDVLLLQHMLNIIATFYPATGRFVQTGIFDDDTFNSVSRFQKLFGLNPDGIVGKETWEKIFEIYYGIIENANLPLQPEQVLPRPYPGYLIKYGQSGDDVSYIQKQLNVVNSEFPEVPKVTVDGNFGSQTRNSVIAFQTKFGLDADGIVGAKTWNELTNQSSDIQGIEAEPIAPQGPVGFGSTGVDVRLIQRYLAAISNAYPQIIKAVPSGLYGLRTEEAIKQFQIKYGLTPTGVVDKETWDYLVEVYKQVKKSGLLDKIKLPPKLPNTPEQTPEQNPGQFPEQPPGEIPGRIPGEIPGRIPGEIPGRIPGDIPGRIPGEIPGRIPGEIPGRIPGEIPGRIPGEIPGRIPGEIPGRIPGEIPGQIPGQIPGRIPGQTTENMNYSTNHYERYEGENDVFTEYYYLNKDRFEQTDYTENLTNTAETKTDQSSLNAFNMFVLGNLLGRRF